MRATVQHVLSLSESEKGIFGRTILSERVLNHVFFLSESEEGNFGLYVVKETGETRRIGEAEFPLLLRYRIGTQ
jgi:hypothetical protein